MKIFRNFVGEENINPMSTLYLHIPFCRRICTYCDFYKVGATALLPRVVEVMHREMQERAAVLHSPRLTSIYFGGGTPSLLSARDIQGFIDHAHALFDCSEVSEITLEANPDDLTPEYVAALRTTSVNHQDLSVGSHCRRGVGCHQGVDPFFGNADHGLLRPRPFPLGIVGVGHADALAVSVCPPIARGFVRHVI